MSCVNVPQIVASQTFLLQTSSLSSTTIYTPAAAALLRVSYYIESSVTGQDVTLGLTWTDNYQTQSNTVANSNESQKFNLGSNPVSVIHSAASQPIAITASFSGSGSYNVYVTVEQLELE